jgi:hypothetical protein
MADRFNIFSESMMTCLEGSYDEPEAIERAKELSKNIVIPRWVVHDNTGIPHFVAVRGEVYFVGTKQSDVYKRFIEGNAYLKERVEYWSDRAIETTLTMGKIKMMLDGLQWELQNHNPDIRRIRQIVDELLPPDNTDNS